jgi:DNA repair protein RadA/Sms
LEKYTSLSFAHRDIYTNVVGGLRISEPAVDLALVAALVSSEMQLPLPASSCFFGEVGLTGEVRAANLALERVKEAVKLGFKNIYLPASNEKYLNLKEAGAQNVSMHWIRDISQLENKFGGTGVRPRAERRVVKTPEVDLD